jgi:3-phenylpropionate/trans-cinnamate dioxygenase ferredoxin subunit
MQGKKLKWQLLIADPALLSWNDQKMTEITVNSKRICLARHQDKIFAFAATCPHAGGSFSQGWIDPLGQIVCPLHRYRFSPLTGRNTSGEGYYLKTYPLEERPDGLYIGFPESGLFG